MDVNDDAGLLEKRGAHTSIASMLAPTVVLCPAQNMRSPQISCGSGLARDGVLESSEVFPALGNVLADHQRIRILPHRKLPLQTPGKRIDLGNRKIRLLRNPPLCASATSTLHFPEQALNDLVQFRTREKDHVVLGIGLLDLRNVPT